MDQDEEATDGHFEVVHGWFPHHPKLWANEKYRISQHAQGWNLRK
jgi:hypothetical protein